MQFGNEKECVIMRSNWNQKQIQDNDERLRDFILEDELLFGNDDDALLENQTVEDFSFDEGDFGF